MYGVRTSVLRITNPYSERQQLKHNKYSLPGWFMRLAFDRKPIKIFGDGGQLRDYVYATDLADAVLAVGLGATAAGGGYQCGPRRTRSLRHRPLNGRPGRQGEHTAGLPAPCNLHCPPFPGKKKKRD